MPWFRNTLFFVLLVLFGVACQSSGEQSTASTQAAAAPDSASADSTQSEKIILFFGNSLTAGYGLEPSEAFPALIQQRLDSLGYAYRTVNAGLSGETTASGKTRLDWVLERQPVDIFVLELGANDGLRGIDPTETQRNLEAIIAQVRETNPTVKIILAGMMVPPNMGTAYTDRFQKIFPELADAQNTTLIPFLLQDVAGEPDLNQADGIHPTIEGQKIVANNVWNVLEPELEPAS